MKTLPKTFSKNGFEFEQLERRGNLALFRKHKRRKCVSYEVIRIQSHGEYVIGGNKIEAGECYPASESWGFNGFTFSDYKDAIKKLAELWAKQ